MIDIDDDIEIKKGTKNDPQYVGLKLLERGFKDWFLFFFSVIESGAEMEFPELMETDLNNYGFIVDDIHYKLFDAFEEVYTKKTKRKIIKVPPRSGKTTMLVYFIAFCLAKTKECNFIYVSYSQELSRTNKDLLWRIINNKTYKEMYCCGVVAKDEDVETVEDSFWKSSFYKRGDDPDFKIKGTRITTTRGGGILFTSLGGQITGFGAGKRHTTTNDFLGCIFLDDPNKPDDMFSETTQDKVFNYFTGTCLTRCNNSDTAIFIIQQTLGERDLSNLVLEKYKNIYSTTIEPLIRDDGVCQLASQYSQESIDELKMNNYLFQTQYQQNVISNEATVIKKEYFNFYDCDYTTLDLTKIFMTVDVAKAVNNGNDNTCICIWGNDRNKLTYLIDMTWQQIEPVAIIPNIISKLQEYKTQKINNSVVVNLSYIYIEKDGNELLLPQLEEKVENLNNYDSTITIRILKRSREFSKSNRCISALTFFAQHKILLPKNQKIDNEIMQKALRECERFRLDNSHPHDDFVDNLIDAALITYGDPGYATGGDNFDAYAGFSWN